MVKARRQKTAERRPEIAAAALRLIGIKGISNLTLTALAKEVGITVGALFRHFESREAILDAAVDSALATLEATFPDSARPPLDRLLAFVRAWSEAVAGQPGIAWLLQTEHSTHALSKEAAWKLDGFVRRAKRFPLDALAEGAARGEIRSDFAPDVLLAPVAGTIRILGGPNPTPARETLLQALAAMLSP